MCGCAPARACSSVLRRGAARRGAYELLGVLGEYERREDQYHKDENHHDDADQGALHQHTHTHTHSTQHTHTHTYTQHTQHNTRTHTRSTIRFQSMWQSQTTSNGSGPQSPHALVHVAIIDNQQWQRPQSPHALVHVAIIDNQQWQRPHLDDPGPVVDCREDRAGPVEVQLDLSTGIMCVKVKDIHEHCA